MALVSALRGRRARFRDGGGEEVEPTSPTRENMQRYLSHVNAMAVTQLSLPSPRLDESRTFLPPPPLMVPNKADQLSTTSLLTPSGVPFRSSPHFPHRFLPPKSLRRVQPKSPGSPSLGTPGSAASISFRRLSFMDVPIALADEESQSSSDGSISQIPLSPSGGFPPHIDDEVPPNNPVARTPRRRVLLPNVGKRPVVSHVAVIRGGGLGDPHADRLRQQADDAAEYRDLQEVSEWEQRIKDTERRRKEKEREAEEMHAWRLSQRANWEASIRDRTRLKVQEADKRLLDVIHFATEQEKDRQDKALMQRKELNDLEVRLKNVERKLQRKKDDTFWVATELDRRDRMMAEKRQRETDRQRAEEMVRRAQLSVRRREEQKLQKERMKQEHRDQRIALFDAEVVAREECDAEWQAGLGEVWRSHDAMLQEYASWAAAVAAAEKTLTDQEERLRVITWRVDRNVQDWTLRQEETDVRGTLLAEESSRRRVLRHQLETTLQRVRERWRLECRAVAADEWRVRQILAVEEATQRRYLYDEHGEEVEAVQLEREVVELLERTSRPSSATSSGRRTPGITYRGLEELMKTSPMPTLHRLLQADAQELPLDGFV